MNLACYFTLIIPLLGGCVSNNTPGDLTFLSVQLVDWRDQVELPGPGASPVLGLVSNHELVSNGQSITGGAKSHRPLLKVEFVSRTNLSKFVIENSYNLGNTAFFCNHEKNSPHMSFSYIFWQGIRLGKYEPDPIKQQSTSVNVPITYYIFIDVAGKERPKDIPPQEGFDLWEQPEDVCFYARGSNESGHGYKSNMVVIPKAAIVAALQKAPPLSGN